ncbi:DUF2975 domain-containing protein [Jiulongibacter sediminis]|uniref:DUF2975 domain-containing protein n=1 Tax=Jiulongibacter sediminis TaxID=1605367 RepID=UPI0026F35083|nr:DUF2975 domain-containing protein [Jiulongibacter sediminis]
MSKNITLALGFAQIFKWVVIALFILMAAFMFTSLLAPDFISDYMLEIVKGGGPYNIFKCEDCLDTGMTVHLNSLSTGMLLWIFLMMSLRIGLLYLISLETIQVLKNVRNLNTFYEGNIGSFRKMAVLGLIMAVLGSFSFLSYFNADQNQVFERLNFSPSLGAIGFSLACFVLTEVFKEGKVLQEDKESIL